MKNEVVKPRTEKHARLRARNKLSSTILNSSQAGEIVPVKDLEKAATVVPGQPQIHSTVATQLHTTVKAAPTQPRPVQSHTTARSSVHPTTLIVGPSSTSSTSTENGGSSGSSVSGVALGVAFGLIGLALLAIAVVWTIRRRNIERGTDERWKKKPFVIADSAEFEKGGDIFAHNSKFSDGYHRLDDSLSISPGVSDKNSIRTNTTSMLQASIALPGKTFNNPQTPSSPGYLTPKSAVKHRETTTVLRSFLPTLPDELQIQQGERIEILQSFDDGWALCLNRQGERGVVPLECLLCNSNKETTQNEDNQNRLSKRASSLYSNTAGTY